MQISKNRALYCTVIILLSLFFSLRSVAQRKQPAGIIHLRDRTISLENNSSKWLDSISVLKDAPPIQVIVLFDRNPASELKAALAQSGIDLRDYLGDKTFTALVKPSVALKDVNVSSLLGIREMQGSWKVPAYLWKKLATATTNVDLLLTFFRDIDPTDIRALIRANGGLVLPGNFERFNMYRVSLPADKLPSLAAWYGLQCVSPATDNEPLDKESKAQEKVAIANVPLSLGGYGLQGDGMTIGIGDNVSGIFHTDLKDRIINYNPAHITHHGVHINGIAGGAGIVDPKAEGVAPHSRIINHLYDNILANTEICHRDYNMTVTNNSYAIIVGDTGYSGTYDAYAQLADNLALQYNTVLHVFAAGNDGYLNRPPYPQGFATVTGGYQPAKNVIVVTSTTKYYVNAADGSRGPVNDGRLRPDITADGADVFSTIDYNAYLTAGGTSMSSPQVAGASLLLAQRYKQSNGNTDPRSDVLKTIILNGSTDIGNPGPDYRYGFGFLNLYRSLQILDSNRYTTNTITEGNQQTVNINVPANTAQLKVMLYWHDAAATPLSAKQLINDLDLTVQDPSSTIHKPLILDPAPANILNNAVEGEDHLNNCEQVTINNPAAGTYTAKVLGYDQPAGAQDYVLAYDFVPQGIKLSWPMTQSTALANDSMRIYWDASDNPNSFTLQYSTDNGNNWNLIDNNVPSAQRYYTWAVPNISSGQCKIQLQRNNTAESSVSGTFAINPMPQLRLDSIQCPGYMRVNWDAVTNAAAYEVMRKIGPLMVSIDTVSTTNYTLQGLSPDSTYYLAIRPIVDGIGGYRSIAVFRRPDSGTCAGNFSNGDLMLQAIVTPGSGRKFTNSELGNAVGMQVRVRNLDDAQCASYQFLYRLNAGPWQTYNATFTLPANADTIIGIPSILDLSAVGTYTLRVAVKNLSATDPVAQNDTAMKVVRQLNNAPLNLASPFIDGFDAMPALTLGHDSMGIAPNEHWDYANTSPDTGRLRSFVNDSITISGTRSISMDANINMPGAQNYLLGTFNLAGYDTATTEIRVDYDYMIAGKPKFLQGNDVALRAADNVNLPWITIKTFDTASVPGQVYNSGTLSITDALKTSAQNFGTALQLRIGQHDTNLIAMKGYGSGMTIDNFRIYIIQHDVQLLSVVNPSAVECGLGNNVPLTVRIYNSVNIVQNNVAVYYKLDNGPVVSESIASIAAKDTIDYTFTQTMQLAAQGVHTLNVWIAAPGDDYLANDTIAGYVFHNEPLVTSFPYLENFEASDGFWYSAGINNSWQYGVPASPKISKAASGTKAWKTNLSGLYNNLETSFLYSPCFDISALSHPMLSFSMASDIENCGSTLCDAAIIEYSFDGVSWSLLGLNGQGTNWYNEPNFQLWNLQNDTRWHVASIPLPVGAQPIRLRFSFRSDQGTTREGIAIDDIHIFDLTNPIYDGASTGPVDIDVAGNQWIPFTSATGILANVQPNGQDLGSTAVSMYTHTPVANSSASQYLFPRNYTVTPSQQPGNSTGLRLYILDSEFRAVISDTTCPSCSKPADAYSLGVTKYSDPNTSHINGSLNDNNAGTYTYYPYSTVNWVPYDKGYYAELNVNSFSEFWFNDGGPTGTIDLATDYLSFNAYKITYNNVKAEWTSNIDTSVSQYELQRSYNDTSFATIYTATALHLAPATYSYIDTPVVADGSSVFYRLRYTLLNSKIFYSATRRVDWISDKEATVYPNPVHDGNIYINWAADAGTRMQVAITNEIGKLVYKNSFTAASYNNTTHIALSRPGSGVYFVKVYIGDKMHVYKIVCW
jgi:hypothetical protein